MEHVSEEAAAASTETTADDGLATIGDAFTVSDFSQNLSKTLFPEPASAGTEGEPGEGQQDLTEDPEAENELDPGFLEEDLVGEPEDQEPEAGRPDKIQKRIDKLTAQKKEAQERAEELEEQLAEAQRRLEDRPETQGLPPQLNSENPFAAVSDIRELEKQKQLAAAQIEFADDMEDTLSTDPGRVEAALRAENVQLKDEFGEEDFSEERMAKFLKQVRRNADRAERKWLPAQEQFIAKARAAEEYAKQKYPWIGNPNSKAAQYMDRLLAEFPPLQNLPEKKLFMARYITGMQAELKAKQQTQPAKPVTTAARPHAARTPSPNSTLKKAAEQASSDRSRDSFKDYIGEALFAKPA